MCFPHYCYIAIYGYYERIIIVEPHSRLISGNQMNKLLLIASLLLTHTHISNTQCQPVPNTSAEVALLQKHRSAISYSSVSHTHNTGLVCHLPPCDTTAPSSSPTSPTSVIKLISKHIISPLLSALTTASVTK